MANMRQNRWVWVLNNLMEELMEDQENTFVSPGKTSTKLQLLKMNQTVPQIITIFSAGGTMICFNLVF